MKLKWMCFAFFFVVFGFTAVSAQEGSTLDKTKAAVQKEKRVFVAVALSLEGNEAERFWRVYDQYEKDLAAAFADKLIALIEDFEKSNADMTDEKAEELVGRWFDLREVRLNLRWDYFKKFDEVLPTIEVARFYQVENHLALMQELEIVETLPFISRAK